MAENLYIVPLTSIPQDFNIVLAGVQLRVVCKWNEFSGWIIDLYSGVSQAPIIMGIPLHGDQYAVPTLDNLGGESNLYYLVDV